MLTHSNSLQTIYLIVAHSPSVAYAGLLQTICLGKQMVSGRLDMPTNSAKFHFFQQGTKTTMVFSILQYSKQQYSNIVFLSMEKQTILPFLPFLYLCSLVVSLSVHWGPSVLPTTTVKTSQHLVKRYYQRHLLSWSMHA